MIRTASGDITTDALEIMRVFSDYYKSLYKSSREVGGVLTDDFLQRISIPTLSEKDRIDIDAPVTLEELKLAVARMPNQKSPGPDGLPVEIYKRYGEVLLPELLKTLGWAFRQWLSPYLNFRSHYYCNA